MQAVRTLNVPLARFKQFVEFGELNERQRRGLYGFIAKEIGYGGATAVARELEVSAITVKMGLVEFSDFESKSENLTNDQTSEPREENKKPEENSQPLAPGRIRRPGGGRKPAVVLQPGLVDAVREILESSTIGDPMRVIYWTTLSLRKIQDILATKGYVVSHTLVARIVEDLGYSKQVNQKMIQLGTPQPDRDEQFKFINEKSNDFLAKGVPVISIDCKKKENIGNFKNNGAEYRPKKDPRKTYDHDWYLKHLGKVAPYGIYVLNDNTGFVNLGQTSDTAEFAGESVARWWHYLGEPNFKDCKKLYIVSDGGGSNGSRVRLWKWVLATIAESYGLEIHVSHLPPGTSKWNKVEHRLFCYISKNWAGKPLTDIETVVNLIGNTTTKSRLKVTCQVDNNVYLRGASISDEEFAQIDMEPDEKFGNWNYVIRGFKA